MMIPTYGTEQPSQEYIDRTTKASGSEEVRKAILKYMERPDHPLVSHVRESLLTIVNDDVLLAKTRIIVDCSSRNCVILVYPDATVVTYGAYSDDAGMALSDWRESAETIFLFLIKDTKEEEDAWWAMYHHSLYSLCEGEEYK